MISWNRVPEQDLRSFTIVRWPDTTNKFENNHFTRPLKKIYQVDKIVQNIEYPNREKYHHKQTVEMRRPFSKSGVAAHDHYSMSVPNPHQHRR